MLSCRTQQFDFDSGLHATNSRNLTIYRLCGWLDNVPTHVNVERPELRHSVPWLTVGMMHDASAGAYACLTLKAYNGRIFLGFLNACLSALVSKGTASAEVSLAALATRTLLHWFHVQETATRFLTPEIPDCI